MSPDKQLGELKPRIAEYLAQFDDCFARKDTRAHFPVYVAGQLSDLPEKSVEPIALEAGVKVRTLQEFLSQHKWDHDRARDRLQATVRDEHAGACGVGIFDETSVVKKGDKTPGVRRQWCGSVGKVENCIVTIHLAYAREGFHYLIDGELFLSEAWAADHPRRIEAGIPDELEYRPKWRIASELYDRASSNGITFEWVTFDEGYGGQPEFLRELKKRGQHYVAEVPRSFTGWLERPRVATGRYRKRSKGRGRKTPRLASGERSARDVESMLKHAKLRDQPWTRWNVKDGQKGPHIWEVKHTRFFPMNESGLPGELLHLIVARDALNPSTLKYFVAEAPEGASLQTMLRVAFTRWRVERCFEDQKSEIGLDQYEGRRYIGLKCHLILSCISYLFLSRIRMEFGREEAGTDGMPGAYRDGVADPVLVVGDPGSREASLPGRGQSRPRGAPQRPGARNAHQAHPDETPGGGYRSRRSAEM